MQSAQVRATTTLTNESATALYAKYVSAWRAIPEEQRAVIAADAIREHARYSTPRRATPPVIAPRSSLITFAPSVAPPAP